MALRNGISAGALDTPLAVTRRHARLPGRQPLDYPNAALVRPSVHLDEALAAFRIHAAYPRPPRYPSRPGRPPRNVQCDSDVAGHNGSHPASQKHYPSGAATSQAPISLRLVSAASGNSARLQTPTRDRIVRHRRRVCESPAAAGNVTLRAQPTRLQ